MITKVTNVGMPYMHEKAYVLACASQHMVVWNMGAPLRAAATNPWQHLHPFLGLGAGVTTSDVGNNMGNT